MVMGDWGGKTSTGAGKKTGVVLVTGGTGFVGSAVVRALLSEQDGPKRTEIRVLSRRRLPRWMLDAGVVEVSGDLTAPSGLRGVCDGVSTVLHLASQIGGDSELCDAVNHEGTRALLREAKAAGVVRIAYLSTTSVYGHGVHRGASESLLAPAPVSATSASRLKAEREVRKAGGVVLRPHLVYGTGDVWFIPTLLRLLDRVPAWIERGIALVSLVSVDDLGAATAALAHRPWRARPGAVFHVSDPTPVSMQVLAGTACELLGLPLPQEDLSAKEHRELTRRHLPELTDHQFELLAFDHYYESSRIWRHAGVKPGPGLAEQFTGATDWYRQLLPT
ncbi:3-beta hydroxysteroid dehydrogenase [Lentzea flava]|uniref:3-beta hydroxysteroid dehydrogenase n=2 Tax=Lentzea flava TaxID=103732 RepID=A0ABQ2UGI5_9PSEU|nr:Nucleoside-diphosphate-sugar epimerase [Lentzea flava]GGU32327.1 3-beta hydroxysteroid dehydrogenase [Lentzea flava]